MGVTKSRASHNTPHKWNLNVPALQRRPSKHLLRDRRGGECVLQAISGGVQSSTLRVGPVCLWGRCVCARGWCLTRCKGEGLTFIRSEVIVELKIYGM